MKTNDRQPSLTVYDSELQYYLETNNCQPSRTVYAPNHLNLETNGGARCNACTRDCSAGIKTNPRTKERHVNARFECPGQCVILSARRNEED